MSDKKYKVKILPNNIETLAEENDTLKKVFTDNNISFEFPCGGLGLCKQCQVKIKRDNGEEERVFACQFKIKEDLLVEITKKEQQHRILSEGLEREVLLDPLVKKVNRKLPLPTLSDNRDDWSRLVERRGIRPSLKIAQELPEKIRENNFDVTIVISDDEIIAIEDKNTQDMLLGMAFDIGTTTVAGYLMDLKSGKELTKVSALNPQTKYGADVISRINFAETDAGLERLHGEIVQAINGLIEEAVKESGFKTSDVYAISVCGNTAMHHLFLNIKPGSLASTPYVPVVTEHIVADAQNLGIKINPSGKVFVLPNIAGFVGGDIVAGALTIEIDRAEKLKLFIDIGTNGEIVLGTKDNSLSCSTAAGPAFEGVEITCGMRGASGAIDHVHIDNELSYTVIDDGLPYGIAGSGLVDIVAELLKAGIIDQNGRILRPEEVSNPIGKKYLDRITTIEGVLSFLIEDKTATGRPVYITQKDVREFQLAKGAIAAGIEVLLKTYGAKADDIDEVFLAGAFGNYLDYKSACRVGLIPRELENKIKGIGNSAGAGAKLFLLSEKERNRAMDIAGKIKYVELSAREDFRDAFFNKINF